MLAPVLAPSRATRRLFHTRRAAQVALLFPRCFWGELDMFGRVAPSTAERGQFFLFYSSAGIAGGAVLVALGSGRAGVAFEQARRRPQSARRDRGQRGGCGAAVAFLLALCLACSGLGSMRGAAACNRQQPVRA